MKKYICILALILSFVNIFAQNYIDFENKYKRTKRVLIVPFDERIYFNDATPEMAKKDGLSHDEIMQFFRHQLNLQLHNSLIDSCEIVDLMSNNTKEDQTDISGIYSTITYKLQLAQFDDGKTPKNFIAKKRAEKQKEQRLIEMENAKAGIKDGELIGQKQNTKDMYLHIVIEQPQALKEIASRRNIDYYFFINQFDIETDYRDPYLSGNSEIKRDLRIHFSIYNANGEFVSGNYAHTQIPYYENSKEEVVNTYFPEIMRQIISKIKY